jgi:glycerol-3-phosphate acyltransferase PlsY
MAAELILLLVGAYLLGAVPAAWVVARLARGIDIRQYGSGNSGVSNLWQSTSKWLALPVILFDFLKGGVAIWAAQRLGLGVGAQAAVGIAAVVGHNWPVFLHWSGGRGMLTLLGVVFAVSALNGMFPWEAVVALSIAALGTVLRNAPLGVLFAVLSILLVSWARGAPLAVTLVYGAGFVITVVRRLTAPRSSLTASVTTRRLLLNRLLLDRDITDRQAWLERRPRADGEAKAAR